MQWYQRWEIIRDQWKTLPAAQKKAWWNAWDTLGVSPWDQHEPGGSYAAQGTLFDVACHHDHRQAQVFLNRSPSTSTNERQSLIDRAAYEAWHRADGALFDLLTPFLGSFRAWFGRLQQHAGLRTTVLPFMDHEGRWSNNEHETAIMMAISVSNRATQAWPLWNERYASAPGTQEVVDHLHLGGIFGSVLNATMLHIDDPRWGIWALATTTSAYRFSETTGEPLLDSVVATIANAALAPSGRGRISRPSDKWMEGYFVKLEAMVAAWGMPKVLNSAVNLGGGKSGTLEQAVNVWPSLEIPALNRLAMVLQRHWLRESLTDGPALPSRVKPRL